MFKKVKEFFDGELSLQVDSSGKATNKDIQIATAVLLLNMAGSDDDYAPEEVKIIFNTLETQFKLKNEEALKLLESADKIRQSKDRVDDFVLAINEHFNERQKQIVLAMIWKVMLADKNIDKFEQRCATQLRVRLQLSLEQAEEAKQLALDNKI